jgi:hypothetical protein
MIKNSPARLEFEHNPELQLGTHIHADARNPLLLQPEFKLQGVWGIEPLKRGSSVRRGKYREALSAARISILGREEGRMWVFIRPRGGKDYYLLMCENRVGIGFRPIHRFDVTDQIPASQAGGIPTKNK